MTETHARLVVLIVAVVAALLGVPLVWRGMRGRRIGEQPLCRRCRFDQTGRPRTSTRCAECGNDLTQRGAVVIGVRRFRLVSLIVGSVILTVGGYALTPWATWRLTTNDWQSLKPLWWLKREATSENEATRDAAMNEIGQRDYRHQLKPAQIDDLTQFALTTQADDRIPWHPGWGAWIEDQHESGRLSLEQTRRYLRQAQLTTWPDVQKWVTRGSSLASDNYLNIGVHSAGRFSGFGKWVPSVYIDLPSRVVTIDEREVPVHTYLDDWSEGDAMTNGDLTAAGPNFALPTDLSLGKHHVHLREMLIIGDAYRPPYNELMRLPVDVEGDFTLTEYTSDRLLAAMIHHRLQFGGWQCVDTTGPNGRPMRVLRGTVEFHGPPSPVPFAYSVSLVGVGRQPWVANSLGTIVCHSGETNMQWPLEMPLQLPVTTNLRMKLRTFSAAPPEKLLRADEYQMLGDRFELTDLALEKTLGALEPAR